MQPVRQVLTTSVSGEHTRPSSQPVDPTPRHDDSLVCELCRGIGYVVDRQQGGKAVPCKCRLEKMAAERAQRLQEASGLTPAHLQRWTFDTFHPERSVGSSRDRAAMADILASCRAFAEQPQGWLVLIGVAGCGKTHLAYAIAGDQIKRGRPALAITVPDMLDLLRDGFKDDGTLGFERRLAAVRDVGLLVLDDLGMEKPTAWAIEKLYQIINRRYEVAAPLVVTTNCNLLAGSAGLEARIASRLRDTQLSRLMALPADDYRLRRA